MIEHTGASSEEKISIMFLFVDCFQFIVWWGWLYQSPKCQQQPMLSEALYPESSLYHGHPCNLTDK